MEKFVIVCCYYKAGNPIIYGPFSTREKAIVYKGRHCVGQFADSVRILPVMYDPGMD